MLIAVSRLVLGIRPLKCDRISMTLTALLAVDMVFKVLVIGVIVFVPRDLQLAYVFLVTLVFLVLSSSVQPYKAERDNKFE